MATPRKRKSVDIMDIANQREGAGKTSAIKLYISFTALVAEKVGHVELFPGSKYKFKNENDTYYLIINNPKVEDSGKYTIEIGGVSSTAFLNVEGSASNTSKEPAVTERLACRLPARELCRTNSLVGRFSQGPPISPTLSLRHCSILAVGVCQSGRTDFRLRIEDLLGASCHLRFRTSPVLSIWSRDHHRGFRHVGRHYAAIFVYSTAVRYGGFVDPCGSLYGMASTASPVSQNPLRVFDTLPWSTASPDLLLSKNVWSELESRAVGGS
ncbi:hypothetical protein PR048_013003 [Dryococelus australis]|uniref:Uncharacterized protein n=1 Tax=Dryococelus australis TaxID=614101 RepID=A0ABQ9HRT0_9NEOP|nr:hypothetical protein PR048_013003 [Dryococelus australis]